MFDVIDASDVIDGGVNAVVNIVANVVVCGTVHDIVNDAVNDVANDVYSAGNGVVLDAGQGAVNGVASDVVNGVDYGAIVGDACNTVADVIAEDIVVGGDVQDDDGGDGFDVLLVDSRN